MKYLPSLIDWNSKNILDLISHAVKIKKNPKKYFNILKNKTMLMKKITLMMMSDAQLKELEEQKYQEELNKFEDEDF